METTPRTIKTTIMQMYFPVNAVSVRDDNTVPELCNLIAQQRRRPLIIVACSLTTIASSWCVISWPSPGAFVNADVILVPDTSPPLEQQCAIAHELQIIAATPEGQPRTGLSHFSTAQCSPELLEQLVAMLRSRIAHGYVAV